jgi:hypothetical protein
MADRGADRRKRRPVKAKAGPGSPRPAQRPEATRPADAKAGVDARVHALEVERNELKVRLEAALARIKELEEGRDLVRNRIDWVIDSLHNMLDE